MKLIIATFSIVSISCCMAFATSYQTIYNTQTGRIDYVGGGPFTQAVSTTDLNMNGFNIDNIGAVGIGTTTPQANLHIYESATPTGMLVEWTNSVPSNSFTLITAKNPGISGGSSSLVYRPYTKNSGPPNFLLNTGGFFIQDSAGTEVFKFDEQNHQLGINGGGLGGSNLNVSGNVSIGAPIMYSTWTAPTDGLLVQGQLITRSSVTAGGSLSINGVAYQWPGADGSANQVLQTNGSKTLSWATSSGGGGASTLAISTGGVIITSPTVRVDFDSNSFNGALGSVNVTSITLKAVSLSSGVTGSLPAVSIAAGSLGTSVQVSSLAAVVTAGSYGSATVSPTITFNAQGQIIGASSNTISSGSSGSAAIAFGTGTTSGFTGTVTSSPTAVVLFDKNFFSGTVQGGSTIYYTLATTGEGWPGTIPSTHSANTADFTVPATGTNTITGYVFTTQANSTYTWLAFINGHSNSSAASGITISPLISNAAQSHMRCGGPNTSATASRFDQGSDASGTPTINGLSAYVSATTNEIVCSGQFSTGVGNGNFQLQVVNKSAAGTFTCEAGGTLHGWRIAPLP